MTTKNVTGRRNPRRYLLTPYLLGLACAGTLLLNGCDEEDNTWKSAGTGDEPDLSLTMAIDLGDSAAPHELLPLDFVLTAHNTGGSDATAVVVADTLPAAVTFQIADASQGSYDPVTGYWSVGDLAPDASATLTLTVVVGAGTRGQTVVNEAAVIAVEPDDPLPGNDRATVSFVVVSSPPHAAPDTYAVPEGGSLTVPGPGILANDSDPEGESFTLQVIPVTAPRFGTLSLYGDGGFHYTHTGANELEDTFRYVITDATAESDTGLVTITINPVNDPPLMQAIPPQTIVEGQIFPTLRLDEFVADADDPDSSLTWVASGAAVLVVAINPGRNATITQPNDDWYGQETITFRVTDPGGLQAESVVTFSVTPVNDPPVVSNIPDQSTTLGGAFLPIPLDDYLFDVDNQDAQILWTFSGSGPFIVTIGANHVATVIPPNPGWVGEVTITFQATDPGGLSDYDTAGFTISPPD